MSETHAAFATDLQTAWPSLPEVARQRIGFASTHRGNPVADSVYGFNVGLHVGDEANRVLHRRASLALSLKAQPVWMRQVHGSECAVLDSTTPTHEDCISADAAFATVPGVAAVVMTADCLPVLIADGKGTAVAAVHCGWRGLLNGVIESTLSRFAAQGLIERDLYAWLGPCIGAASFEVGSEVHHAFVARHQHHEICFQPHPVNSGKWLCDLQGLARLILQRNASVVIDADRRDTFRDPDFNSFRRNPVTGRQASLIWLRA
jgi:polyphenol oxidase